MAIIVIINDNDNDDDVAIPVCQGKRNRYSSACISQVSLRRYFVSGGAIFAQHCPRGSPSIV